MQRILIKPKQGRRLGLVFHWRLKKVELNLRMTFFRIKIPFWTIHYCFNAVTVPRRLIYWIIVFSKYLFGGVTSFSNICLGGRNQFSPNICLGDITRFPNIYLGGRNQFSKYLFGRTYPVFQLFVWADVTSFLQIFVWGT